MGKNIVTRIKQQLKAQEQEAQEAPPEPKPKKQVSEEQEAPPDKYLEDLPPEERQKYLDEYNKLRVEQYRKKVKQKTRRVPAGGGQMQRQKQLAEVNRLRAEYGLVPLLNFVLTARESRRYSFKGLNERQVHTIQKAIIAERQRVYEGQATAARRKSEGKAKSEAVIQQEQRAVAAQKGIAVGTISKEGTANISVGSVSSQVSGLTRTPERPAKLYKVTLQDTVGVSDKTKVRTSQPVETRVQGIVKGVGIIGHAGMGFYEITTPSKTRITQAGFPLGPPEPPKKEPLERVTEFLEEKSAIVRKNPILSALFGVPLGATKTAVGTAISLVNLSRLGAAGFGGLVTGEKQLTPKEIPIPKTPTSEGLSGVIHGTIETEDIGKGFQKGGEKFVSTVKEVGIQETIGDIAFLVAPLGKTPLKLSPIKPRAFPFLTETGGIKTIRSLELGFGIKTKEIIKPKIEPISEIGAVERGLELTTQGPLGTKILTSEKGVDILVKSEKALPRARQVVPLLKQAARDIEFSQKKIPTQARLKTDVLPSVPLSTVKPGRESQVLTQELLPRFPRGKGTLAETVQLEEQFLARPRDPVSGLRQKTTGDFDVDFGNLFFGERRAAAAQKVSVEKLSKVAEPGRRFIAKGRNVTLIEGKEKPETVLNILTKRDVKQSGSLAPKGQTPFNIKLKSRTVKLPVEKGGRKKVKFVTIEQQAMNRIESMLSLQGPKTEKFRGEGKIPFLKTDKPPTTPKGFDIQASEFRLKDDVKLLVQAMPQIGKTLKDFGYTERGQRLITTSEKVRKLYPEIDFDIGKQPQKITFDVDDSPSSVSSFVSSSKGPSTTGAQTLTRLQTPQKKEQKITPLGKPASKPLVSRPASKPTTSILSTSKPTSVAATSLPYLSYSPASVSRMASSTFKSLGVDSKPSPLKPSRPSTSKPVSPSTFSPLTGSPTKPSPGTTSPGSPGSPGKFGARSAKSAGSLTGPRPPVITERPKPLGAFILFETRKDPPYKVKPRYRADFIGNVPVSEIVGVKKRADIKYGRLRTAKLAEEDVKKSKKGLFIKSKKPKLLGARPTNFFTRSKKVKIRI